MQAYAYCGCYYNDPANLTSCANGELQSKAASSQTLVPVSTLPTPASASSTVPPIPPISIYPVESANAITNALPPPTGPPLSAGSRAVVSTISTTSLAIISGPAAVYLSTYTCVYVTTFYYCGDLPCPTSTSTFSTTVTTIVDAPGVAAPSKVDAPKIEKSLITEDLTYTTTLTGSDFTMAGTGTSETVDTVYIDPAPIDPAHAAPDPAQPEVSERTTEARRSPAETAAAGDGAGGKGGVCLGKLRKRTSVLIVEG